MNIVIRFIKFLFFCVLTAAEYALKMLLEIVLQAKKAFQ